MKDFTDSTKFDGTVDVSIVSSVDSSKTIEDGSFQYSAKVIDTQFESGSEELMSFTKTDGPVDHFNYWVLDRFSQRKSIGMIIGSYLNVLL